MPHTVSVEITGAAFVCVVVHVLLLLCIDMKVCEEVCSSTVSTEK